MASSMAVPSEAAVVEPRVRPGRAKNGDKLPIYPVEKDEVVTLIETPNPLVPYIAQAREATTNVFGGAATYVEGGVSRWIGFERKVERELGTVLPKDESLNPGIIYVLIAGLTGSVLTRTRSFPLRFLTPPAFALTAMPYFLPKTSHNLRSYLSDVEDRAVPDFARRHDQLNSRLSMHWHMAKDRLDEAGQSARGWTQSAVEGVERNTGLRVGDVVRRGQEQVEREKEKLRSLTEQRTAGGLETVGYVVEQRPIAEIVRPVDPAASASPLSGTTLVGSTGNDGKRVV